MVNKIGDIGVLLGIASTFLVYHSVDFGTIFILTPYIAVSGSIFFCSYKFSYISLIGFFLFIGAVGKSAQLGLHT
jgi:NADH-quinone oxidoreductase subunit L